MTYKFRSDDGKEIEVSFDEMMNQQGGYIIRDGELYRRVGSGSFKKRTTKPSGKTTKEIISDTLGFGQHQLQEMEADRKANGFKGVEFTRDPHVPEFFQVRCDSPKTWHRYLRHRGFTDKNSKNGGAHCITEQEMEQARKLVDRVFGESLTK